MAPSTRIGRRPWQPRGPEPRAGATPTTEERLFACGEGGPGAGGPSPYRPEGAWDQESQDAAVNPKVPRLLSPTRSIGPSPSQNAQLQVDVQWLKDIGADNIRVNQQQLKPGGQSRVGINRPDLQFDYNGRRYHVEYDTPASGRGPSHQSRLTSNDPDTEIILLIIR